jgi:hypothetical protein
LYFKNLPEILYQWEPESSFIDTVKKHAIEKLFTDMADQMHSIISDSVNITDFLHQINYGTFQDAQCYSTATMMQRYPDGAHIGGHLGNESLLHWHIYINDVLDAGHDIEQIKELSKGPVYSQNHVLRLMIARIEKSRTAPGQIKNYDLNALNDTIDPTDCDQWLLPVMEFKHHNQTPRASLNIGPVKFYHPLMDEDTSQLHRKLHWKDIDFSYLVDAKLARDILKINVGNMLDQYVTVDGLEVDSWGKSFMLSAEKINPKILQIPDNLNHDDNGVKWLRYVSKHAHTHGINTHNLISFKALDQLSKLCAGELDLWSPNPRYKF